jgi:hypothetical protein
MGDDATIGGIDAEGDPERAMAEYQRLADAATTGRTDRVAGRSSGSGQERQDKRPGIRMAELAPGRIVLGDHQRRGDLEQAGEDERSHRRECHDRPAKTASRDPCVRGAVDHAALPFCVRTDTA